ncbi:hypothetical protein [Brachyspira sp.]|uniref:hypothetical protein n=1 Tax=Brachyspira sp. TaxID=1977261 RepID=UPI003D7D1083
MEFFIGVFVLLFIVLIYFLIRYGGEDYSYDDNKKQFYEYKNKWNNQYNKYHKQSKVERSL